MAGRPYLSENPMWEMFGMRAFALVPYGSADIGEVSSTVARVGVDGTADDWYREWTATAVRLAGIAAEAEDRGHAVSAREAWFRAATYYAVSYFPLYGAPVDPRLVEAFDAMSGAMARGVALCDHPVTPIDIPFEGGSLPGLHVRCADDGVARPTIVHTNGYDSTLWEMYAAHAPAAVARGYDMVLFDGPGQGHELVHSGTHLRPDWETVVRPVIDHALTLDGVDVDRVVLAGWSFGGYLAPRAAAFEDRIAALVADPGQWDLRDGVVGMLPLDDAGKAAFPDVDPALFDPLEAMVSGPSPDPFLRWQLVQRGQWVNGADSVYAYLADMCRYELSSVASQITCPTWLSAAEGDPTGAGATTLLAAIGSERKELAHFTDAEGTGGHCEATARRLFHQRMYDWLDETLADTDR
ncbi:MAG: alpha/beta fold hydrolase [Acidimicrobiia bacterium]|nr:alpha/beta fold hydrolase [Acidimicrobiia bacterium]